MTPTQFAEHLNTLRKPGLYRDALWMYFDCLREKAFGNGNPGLGNTIQAALESADADLAAGPPGEPENAKGS